MNSSSLYRHRPRASVRAASAGNKDRRLDNTRGFIDPVLARPSSCEQIRRRDLKAGRRPGRTYFDARSRDRRIPRYQLVLRLPVLELPRRESATHPPLRPQAPCARH